MWRPLRRFLGVAALACGGMTACGTPQPEAGAPASPVEPAPALPEVPPVREEQACPRLPPGSLPTEALEALAPRPAVGCSRFPGACGPEPLRRTFTSGSAQCSMTDPYETVTYSVEYDTRGRLTDYGQTPGGWEESYRYDDCGRLEYRSVDSPGLGPPDVAQWRFGPDGRLVEHLTVWFNMTTVTRFSYSDSGRLLLAETQSNHSGYTANVRRQRYTHDAQGRIVKTEYEALAADGSAPAAVTHIEERSYDASGALSELRSKTPSGTTTSVKTFSEGRLVREETFSGNSRREQGWAYLPEGLLAKDWQQTEDAGTAHGTQTVYSYDGARRLEQVETLSTSRAADGTETQARFMERLLYTEDGGLSARRVLQPETGTTLIEWRYEGSCY